MNSHRHSGKERRRWTALAIIAIVIVVGDAATLGHQMDNASEIGERTNEKELKNPVMEQITYEGDQVWRIWKTKDDSEELVQRYDEDGCTYIILHTWNTIINI